VFLRLWASGGRTYLGGMSDNYRFYAQKVSEQRAARRSAEPSLRHQLEELLDVVVRCEAIWAIEDRIERSL
jgi:hypothetical protein